MSLPPELEISRKDKRQRRGQQTQRVKTVCIRLRCVGFLRDVATSLRLLLISGSDCSIPNWVPTWSISREQFVLRRCCVPPRNLSMDTTGSCTRRCGPSQHSELERFWSRLRYIRRKLFCVDYRVPLCIPISGDTRGTQCWIYA